MATKILTAYGNFHSDCSNPNKTAVITLVNSKLKEEKKTYKLANTTSVHSINCVLYGGEV
jgi:hypothetical protein